MGVRRAVASGVAIAAAFALTIGGWAQEQKGEHPKAPARTTIEELHKHGGVPPGWQFTLPDGKPKAGREVFVKLECYKCHEVKKERFPTAPARRAVLSRAPARVQLWFNERLEPQFSTLTVRDQTDGQFPFTIRGSR